MRTIVALLMALWSLQAWAELQVVYPNIAERATDSYGFKVLKLALDKSGVAYRLSVSPQKMNQERARLSIEDGSVSIFDTGTSADFEKRFDAVYFPVDRGISGYRLFIINKALAPRFAAIRNLQDLQTVEAGQGPGWADTKILEAAGIRVDTAEFDSLFRMVDSRRFDFYPLGVEEIYGLFESHSRDLTNSIVETTVALHYPFGRLFFVRKGNQALLDAVQRGLEKAFADGSFQDLFDNDPSLKQALALAKLPQRKIIEIDNLTLSPRFREIPAKYFYGADLKPAGLPPIAP